jgi:hypothetical protein
MCFQVLYREIWEATKRMFGQPEDTPARGPRAGGLTQDWDKFFCFARSFLYRGGRKRTHFEEVSAVSFRDTRRNTRCGNVLWAREELEKRGDSERLRLVCCSSYEPLQRCV